jgi:hypothetical protein
MLQGHRRYIDTTALTQGSGQAPEVEAGLGTGGAIVDEEVATPGFHTQVPFLQEWP